MVLLDHSGWIEAISCDPEGPLACLALSLFYWYGVGPRTLNPTEISGILLQLNAVKTIQFSSVTQSCLTLCDPMDCSTPGFPVLHQHQELAQTHVHRVGDVIQPYHPLSSPAPPPAFKLSQHQGLFQGVSSLHKVAEVLKVEKC